MTSIITNNALFTAKHHLHAFMPGFISYRTISLHDNSPLSRHKQHQYEWHAIENFSDEESLQIHAAAAMSHSLC